MNYTLVDDFESFWEVIRQSDYKPPLDSVRKGIHLTVKIDGVPSGCARLIPYPNRGGEIRDYAFGNFYVLDDLRKGNRHGLNMFRIGLNDVAKRLRKDIIIFGTVGKDRYGQVLKRCYEIFGCREVKDESYKKYLKTELNFEPAPDQVLMYLDLKVARVTEA